jgi:hypothetical protein
MTNAATPQRTQSVASYSWSGISALHLGRYAEYFVKMECARVGLDLYASEVDDRGIDFVIRKNVDQYFDVQVKSVRGFTYVFMRKSTFELRQTLLLAFIMLTEGQAPDLYLIPATTWAAPNALFVGRGYGEGKKSPPEWGLNLSKRNLPLLERYRFESVVRSL